ncbi:STAS domain-containing protein [Streptomyces sp. OE57]|uniref:STAS domain-containing protein n=1 Tax=Streptomyces lacaronensis TaxID=3379885 RepID=UPI0039B75848
MDALKISFHRQNAWPVIQVDGELDLATRDQLRHHLDKLIAARNPARIIVDFSRLSFCDASGLSTLAAADREARRRHGGLRLVCPEGKVRRLLRLTQLARFIPVFDSLSQAIADGESGPYSTSPRQTAV